MSGSAASVSIKRGTSEGTATAACNGRREHAALQDPAGRDEHLRDSDLCNRADRAVRPGSEPPDWGRGVPVRVLMKRRIQQRDERGAVAIVAGLLSVVLLGMTAFTVDFGMAYSTKRQLSSASDAAALAADAIYKTEYQGLCTVPGNDPNNPVAANANVRADAEAAADSLFLQNYPKGARPTARLPICRATVRVCRSPIARRARPVRRSAFCSAAQGPSPRRVQPQPRTPWEAASARCVCSATSTRTTLTSPSAAVTSTWTATCPPARTATGPRTNSITISGTVSGLSQSHATPDWMSGPHIAEPFPA